MDQTLSLISNEFVIVVEVTLTENLRQEGLKANQYVAILLILYKNTE